MNTRQWAALAALAAVVAPAGCSGSSEPQPESRVAPKASSAEISDLHNVLDLRAAFNDDRGLPRLILLLSPT